MSVPAIALDGIAASRKRIQPFALFRPASVTEACELLASRRDAVLHAGGIDLVSRMKAGFVAPAVIALDGIDEIKRITRCRNSLDIGAAVTHWQIEHDDLVRSYLPSFADYVAGLGNVRIRRQGTIGGNVMAGEAGYEMLAALAALDARLSFAGSVGGQRYVVSARDALTAPRASGDILVAISIPLPAPEMAWSRDLRPNLGIVAALSSAGDASDGYGAITGQLCTGHAIGFAQSRSRREIADAWAASIRVADESRTPDPVYVRHVLGVLMRRLLVRLAGSDR